MANKLELTWVGKEKEIKVEPRILIENPQLSNMGKVSAKVGQASFFEEPTSDHFDNMLIHGDNLLALKALEAKYAGQIKCIYIDPPYNTGNAFEHYDDNLEHSIWLNLMRSRLDLLRRLLSDEGSIWIQIDDEEQAYLKVLCDEVFGRQNFVNMISVNMKNTAGASGGGEDKRLKKNCEYILVYAKDYDKMPIFKGAYVYTEISDLIKQYIDNGSSWKYTSVLLYEGDKEYVGSTVDGEGNDIKIYLRKNPTIKSVNQVAREQGVTEKEVYKKYGINIFQTTNAQTSIRTRVMEKRTELGIKEDLISIEYIPKTGKNKGKVYEQFYKGDKCRLFVWLRDTSEVIDGELYKKELQGTYWDFNGAMKNLTKEGNVVFPSGKKPEQLVARIIEMATEPNDLVLDSFLGSGTTAATAHKLNRRWIGIEMGDHAYSHCKVRLDKVISGEDKGGITLSKNWKGGGGYKFYELAPSLVVEDKFGMPIINKEYNADMLSAAMALHEGYSYEPDENYFWKQGKNENSYIFTTTQHVTESYLEMISKEMQEGESLIVACKSYEQGVDKLFKNIFVKKIPKVLLDKCQFGVENYNLNIIDIPEIDEDEE